MGIKKIDFKVPAKYNGHNVKASGVVEVNFKAGYGDLTETISLLQVLNNDIKVGIKMHDEKPFGLGTFRLANYNVGHDGEVKIKLSSTSDFAEVNNMNKLIVDEPFIVRFKAEVELEGEDEDDEEE